MFQSRKIYQPHNSSEKQIHFVTLDILIYSLLLIGLLSVASSSFSYYPDDISFLKFFNPPKGEISKYSTSPWDFFKQLIYSFLGIAVYLLFSKLISMNFLFKYRYRIAALIIILLFLVLFSPLGLEINQSKRWLNLYVITFQPSELAKISMVICVAGFLADQQKEVLESIWQTPLKMAVILFFFIAPIIGEDLSTSVIYMLVALTMLAMAGYRLKALFVSAGFLIAIATVMILFYDYRSVRIDTMLRPWDFKWHGGFQALQAFIAQYNGGLFGTGYGLSLQKLGNVPEPHNDFIVSIMIEEWGIIPVLIVLLFLFSSLIYVILEIAREAFKKKQFASSYYCYGIAAWIFSQSLINISINLGVGPVTGLSLPFISYGGSSLVVLCIALSMVRTVLRDLNGTKKLKS